MLEHKSKTAVTDTTMNLHTKFHANQPISLGVVLILCWLQPLPPTTLPVSEIITEGVEAP